MTTYTTPMLGVTIDDATGNVLYFSNSVTGVFTIDETVTSFTYTADPSGLANTDIVYQSATIDGTSIDDMSGGAGADVAILQIDWNDGTAKTAFVMVFYDEDVDESYLFQLGGDTLPTFANQTEFEIFAATQLTYRGAPLPGSGYEPGDTITLPGAGTYGITSTEDDTVTGTDGDDDFFMGAGADDVTAGDGNDSIDGGSGNDYIDGGKGNDRLEGGSGLDEIAGGNGRDSIYGQGDDDIISGGNGADYIVGGGGDDDLFGGIGNDRINGGGNADNISGDEGNDNLYGNGGRDTITGGADNDRLIGGGGHDDLDGGAGGDTLSGGRGRDTLTGGAGDDTLTGGSDKDQFVFATGSGDDTITDWQDGVDTLVLQGFVEGDVTIADDGSGNALVTFGSESITLTGIDFTTLNTTDDFDFI